MQPVKRITPIHNIDRTQVALRRGCRARRKAESRVSSTLTVHDRSFGLPCHRLLAGCGKNPLAFSSFAIPDVADEMKARSVTFSIP